MRGPTRFTLSLNDSDISARIFNSMKLQHTAFWERMDKATRNVDSWPAWIKGSPKNEGSEKPMKFPYAFPFVTRSLYDSRIAELRAVIEEKSNRLTAWVVALADYDKTIAKLSNRVANLHNTLSDRDVSIANLKNALAESSVRIAELRTALIEADTVGFNQTAEINKLKAAAKCLKTSSKRKKSA